MSLSLLVMANILAMLAGEPKDTVKTVDFFNDGSTSVTVTLAGAAPVTLAPHEHAERSLPEFGTYLVVLDNGGPKNHGRNLALGDEDGFYVPPKTIHWCIVGRNNTLTLLQRQECSVRLRR